jgi:hypothetical protein
VESQTTKDTERVVFNERPLFKKIMVEPKKRAVGTIPQRTPRV